MTFDQTVAYLYELLPMFQRQGASALRKYDLEKSEQLCTALGNPQQQLRCIHVAGTNGKGSVSSMLAACLTAAGNQNVGLFTSPHLICFTERIRLNGKPITQEWVVNFVAKHRELIEDLRPSFFELTSAMAFACFAELESEVCVIEVGMGGRLDSTNIILPLLTVITRIGWDHMEFLGDTLPLIAAEKAGIIKPGVPVVVGLRQAETLSVFEDTAAKHHAPLSFANENWRLNRLEAHSEANDSDDDNAEDISGPKVFPKPCYDALSVPHDLKWDGLELALRGNYQRDNLATVLECVARWNALPEASRDKPVTEAALREGLANVYALSGLRGRFEVWPGRVPVVLDVAHNPEGLASLFAQILRAFPADRLRIIIGVVREKDRKAVLDELPAGALYYATQASVPRALPLAEWTAALQGRSFRVQPAATPLEALAAARQDAPDGTCIVVAGSVFVVADVLAGMPTG